MTIRWGVKWNGNIMWDDGMPLLFETCREARIYIDGRYGYIRDRKDLRGPPCNWHMAKAVRVEVILKELTK